MMTEILGYLAIMCVGLVLGTMGAGGSMLAIPVLVYLFSMDMVIASAYSLFMVGITSLVGAVCKHKDQLVDVRAGLIFGIPSIITTFIVRKWIIGAIPHIVLQTDSFYVMKDELLLYTLSCLIIASSLMMISGVKSYPYAAGRQKLVGLVPAGITVGFLAGMMGAGGGFLILPALVIFAKLPFPSAVGTTLFIIASNSLLGFCGDILNHAVNWAFLLTLTALATLGLLIGGWWKKVLAVRFFSQRLFGWIMLFSAIVMLVIELYQR